MITIFTPTYNRLKLLKRCYKSIASQTNKNFEWMVVDDGSTDGTKEYIDDIKKTADFKIIYIYKKNGGKASAHNEAVKVCEREFILILDSDDILTPDAIEVLDKKSKMIRKDEKICGIVGNKGLIDSGDIVGKKMPPIDYVSGLELYQKMKHKGDTLRLYKTSVLKQFLFPEIEKENFLSENVIFDKIDQKYKMLVIKDVLYLCEYQKNGISNNIYEIRLKNPIGYALSLKSTAETALTLKKKFGVTILYIMWTRKFNIKNSFRDFKCKIVYVLCWPISFIFQILRIPKFYYNMFRESNDGRK